LDLAQHNEIIHNGGVILLNRLASLISLLSGFGLIAVGVDTKELATALSGFGACTMAVVLFQLADLRLRMIRLEDCLLIKPENFKRKR
jgi:hypothetical protein